MTYTVEFDPEKFPWSKQAKEKVDAINASPDRKTIWSYFASQWEGYEQLPSQENVDDCMKYWDFPNEFDGLRVYSATEDFFVFKKNAFETISEKLAINSPEDEKYKEIVETEWPDDLQMNFEKFVGPNRDVSFSEYKQFIMDYELPEGDEEEEEEE